MVSPKNSLCFYKKNIIYLSKVTYIPPPPTLRNRVTCCCSKAWRRCCKRCRASRVSISKRFRRSSLLPSKKRNAALRGELVGVGGLIGGWMVIFVSNLVFFGEQKILGKVVFKVQIYRFLCSSHK